MRLILAVFLILATAPLEAVDLNARGQVAAGVGNGIVSIDRQIVDTSAGGVRWESDDVIVYQHCTDRCRLIRFDTRTGARTLAADRGASVIAAGGGVWAAWLGDGVTGLFTSTGLNLPAAGLVAVGPDGSIAYKPQHQSHGPYLIQPPTGAAFHLSDVPIYDVQLLGGRRVLWMENGALKVTGIPVPRTLNPNAGIWGPKAVEILNEWWLLYTSGEAGGLVLHPFGQTVGYLVNRGGTGFGADVTWLGGTRVRVAWSVTEGELPGDVRTLDLDVARDPRVDLTAPIVTPPPPPPPPPPVTCGEIPARGQDVLRQLAAKFPDELRSADDNGRRAWALKAAQQLAFSIDQAWGSKRAGEGRPLTKDAVARYVGQTLCGWDLVNGTTRALTFGPGADISGQVFFPVDPIDHVGGAVEPPLPPPDCEACRAEIVTLTATVRDLRAAAEQAERDAAQLRADRETAERERDDARRERDALANRPPPRCTASIFGIRIPCRVIQE